MENTYFPWQHIKFKDGRPAYVCKTENDFRRIKEHFVLEEFKYKNTWLPNFWLAIASRVYVVYGYNRSSSGKPVYKKDYETRSGAQRGADSAVYKWRFPKIVIEVHWLSLDNRKALLKRDVVATRTLV